MQGGQRLWQTFDLWVLRILQIVLAIGVVAAIGIVVLLLIRGIPRALGQIGTVTELQDSVQALFAGTLLVVLGMELLETLRHYFLEHRLRVELLLSVALTAVARHVIQLDYEHITAASIAAVALMVLTLTGSYIGVRAFVGMQRTKGSPPS
jgi:uncharacterized membrane protein (DUF373 family)